MFELKTLSVDAVPHALVKAERYRLLGEPGEARSICLDVLAADPDNQEALRTMILSLTDQFGADASCVREALDTIPRLHDEYDRAYFTGIVYERRAKAHLARRVPRGESQAYVWLQQAMRCYDEADAIRPADNEDARLRWNACARLIDGNHDIAPSNDDVFEPLLSE